MYFSLNWEKHPGIVYEFRDFSEKFREIKSKKDFYKNFPIRTFEGNNKEKNQDFRVSTICQKLKIQKVTPLRFLFGWHGLQKV